MGPVFTRLRRVALAFPAAFVAFLLSPATRMAAAEDGGLGAGGAIFAFNYTWILGLILAFIFGFGLRDYIQKRMLRAQAKKRPAPKPVAKSAPAAPGSPRP